MHEIVRLRRKLQKRNHPAKGSSIKVEPIRDLAAIAQIKLNLQRQPRNLCLFTMGINTAYRASELLSFRIRDVLELKVGDSSDIKQFKNKKYRQATLNNVAYDALHAWIRVHPNPAPDAPLFVSQRSRSSALGVAALSRLAKSWCDEIGLIGNYASHSFRKTWGYQHRIQYNTPLVLLMRAYGHASEAQTLDYLGIQSNEVKNLFLQMEL